MYLSYSGFLSIRNLQNNNTVSLAIRWINKQGDVHGSTSLKDLEIILKSKENIETSANEDG